MLYIKPRTFSGSELRTDDKGSQSDCEKPSINGGRPSPSTYTLRKERNQMRFREESSDDSSGKAVPGPVSGIFKEHSQSDAEYSDSEGEHHGQSEQTSEQNWHSRRRHRCGECGKGFSQSSDLKAHLRTHTGERPFECPECHKCFSRKSHRDTHLRVYCRGRPYRCLDCSRAFRSSAELSKHCEAHTRKRQHQCTECKKYFASNQALSLHRLIHTGEMPFQCSDCDKSFRHPETLSVHRRLHTGEKPFQCPQCKKCFIQRAHLNSHICLCSSEGGK